MNFFLLENLNGKKYLLVFIYSVIVVVIVVLFGVFLLE